MKIREIKIQNWRSIRGETISFQDLMILIGQNNHGKSNVIFALLFFFGEIGIDPLDFNSGSDELFIEVLFGDLDDNDRRTFKKYLTAAGTIRVRKQAKKDDGFSYHGYVETPTEDWLKEERISDYTKREVADTLPLSYLLPESGRITKEVFREAQERYIQECRDSLTFNYELESGPFLGAKNVPGGIFGDVYFVPSVKRAADDLTAKGRSVFREAKNRISSLICILNKTKEDGTENTSRPRELADFEESLQLELANWNTTIDVEIMPPNLDDIFKVGATVWINDGIRTDVSRKGQGLQRALIFALVRSLAKLSRQQYESAPETDDQPAARQKSKSTYFILEEPELYLHPQAQREVFDSLVALSKGENQVILFTHSSSFISLEYYRSICIVRKNSLTEGTTVFQCKEELFPAADEKALFNLTYWINPDRGELFFARKVILTEGPTEKTTIPFLAHRIGVFRHDYTIIDCGSKDSIPSYLHLLSRFRIPYVVVYDLDHQAGKTPEAIASADKASARIEIEIDATLGGSVILENDIEEEIGITDPSRKNKPYMSLGHIASMGFVISPQLKAKIETIYA
jgi:CRISPR-associated exonuclease Cas4